MLLFRKSLGRLSFIKNTLLFFLIKQLDKKSSRLLQGRSRQLAIFAHDHIGHAINLGGVYEGSELDVLFEWLQKCRVDMAAAAAIDIGANIGNHSLYFSDYFKHVYSFEPSPRTFKLLSINAELMNNITCFDVGISDSNRSAQLSSSGHNIGGASVTEALTDPSQTVELRILDSFAELKDIKLIKIDVEGHELPVIMGAKNTILKNQPIILFEQHWSSFKNGESPVIETLKTFGYQRFAIIKKYPRADGSKWNRLCVVPLKRLILGESYHIQIEDPIIPATYSFIIALPDCFFAHKNH